MCCFTGPVAAVAETNLFARASSGNRQFLVYQMALRADQPVAMILPLPVPGHAGDEAVRFIDFRSYPHFFTDLQRPFAAPANLTRSGGVGGAVALPVRTLAVHQSGSFEASFVPTLADFARLDARFRIAPEVWERLPLYADWGFAVFKLRELSQITSVEPMALEFARRDSSALFFPTVHIHDGQVHERATFDHNLFFQAPGEGVLAAGRYTRLAGSSDQPVREYASPLLARGILDENSPLQVARFAGDLPNRDTRLLSPPADPALKLPQGPMASEAAVALVTRLMQARQNDALDDPAAASAALDYLPWCSQNVGFYGTNLAPPEYVSGKPYAFDERSEVYAFGALLHRLIGGTLPFGEGFAALVGNLTEPPPPLDSPLDAVVRRAMAKSPEERFPSLVAFGAALEA